MALDPEVLTALWDTKLREKLGELYTADVSSQLLAAFLPALAEGVIEHLTTAGSVAVTVASVSGVTTGAGTSGSGTGTGTIH